MRRAALFLAAFLGLSNATPASAASTKPFRDCRDCPQMLALAGGAFTMGSGGGWTGPPHPVTVKAFALGVYPVTRGQYAAFAKAVGADVAGVRWQAPDFVQSDNDPVVQVSWNQAQAYVRWLSARAGKAYRLPSEAEWEYAARAGTTGGVYWGPDAARPTANCNGCGSRWDNMRTAPAGSFAANALGLHDMLGNAWEWMQDCFTPGYAGAPADGSARLDGDCQWRSARGGAYSTGLAGLGVDRRSRDPVDYHGSAVGLRVARGLD